MKKLLKLSILPLLTMTSSFAHAGYFGASWSSSTVNYKLSTNPEDSLTPAQKATFEAAVNYFNTKTKIRLVDTTSNTAVTGFPVSRISGNVSYGSSTCFLVCNPSLKLSESANIGVAIHEIMHVLGFFHEHQRKDRNNYVEINFNSDGAISRPSDYSIVDYPLFYEQELGNYDYDSIMQYPFDMMLKLNNADTLSRLKDPSPIKAVRILLSDSTPDNSFDNLALNNENSTSGSTSLAFKATTFMPNWGSAKFDVIPQSVSGTFLLKHHWSNKYLTEVSGNFSLVDVGSIPSTGALPSQRWQIIDDNGSGFKIQNAGSSKWLNSGTGAAVLSATTPSNWLIKMETVSAQAELSLMDNVALHKFYGYPFRIVQVDNTPNDLTDNTAINTEHGIIEVNSAPQNWFSAKWYLERPDYTTTRWIRIKNRHTGEYLHVENGIVDDALASATNSNNVLLPQWFSAQWEFVIKKDFFYIKNRFTGAYLYNNNGMLNTGTTPNDSYRWQLNAMPVNF